MSGVLGAAMAGFTGPFIMVIARDRLHTSATVLGLMTAAPFLGNLFAMVWANAMDGRNKVPFVVWSTLAARAMFFLTLFATTSGTFATVIIISSLLTTVASPAYAAVMKEIYPNRIRGRAMAYCRVCTVTISVLSVLMAGRLLDTVSYRWVFPVAALRGVGSSLVFGTIRTAAPLAVEKRPTHLFLLDTINILRDDKPFRWFAVSIFTVGFGNLIVVPLYAIFQVDCLHIRTWQVSWLSTLSLVVAVFGYFYWGSYIDKNTPLKAAAVSVLLFTATPLTYGLAATWPHLLPAASMWLVLLPAAAIQGISGAGIELSYFNSVLRFSSPERVSHYQAVFTFLLGVRGTIAPLVGAALIQHNLVGMQPLFFLSVFLSLVSVALQVYGTRTHSVR
jgi:MFS transporter, DHA1 family, inner membrane transport protein